MTLNYNVTDPQYEDIIQDQRGLYQAWIWNEDSPEGREFRAPTTDPLVAWARRVVEPGNTQEAVTEIPSVPPLSPFMPDYAPSAELEPYARPFRQISPGPEVSQAMLAQERPIPVLPDSHRIPPLCVPVALADCVLFQSVQTPRYAILGPAQGGMLWRDRQIRLVHEDYRTVTLKRNLGRSTLKPWCTVIEAEYYDEGFPRSRILLAATYLLDRSFMEGSIQAPWYTGNGLEAAICDRGPARDLGPQYGVLYAYYERADEGEESPEDTTTVNSDGTDEEEGGYWHILADEQDSP
ncbi:hypothetical protein FB451DRAFT_1196863 [Mycena latifolia]|nr:hypothetical protein FB451DRAFT_1196863 [Mycena latifolia]